MMFDLICLCFVVIGVLLLIMGNINIRKNKNKISLSKQYGKKICVLIPARNESKVIEGLLKSLKEQSIKFNMEDAYVIVESEKDKTVKNF